MIRVTPQGLERDSVTTVVARIKQRLRSSISPTLDVSDESELGQLIGVFAEELGVVSEGAEVAYEAFDPDKAEDATLVNLCKLTGTTKRGPAPSRVPCTVALDAGAELIAGQHFAHVEGRPQDRFTPAEDFTAPSDGTFPMTFVSEQPGPVQAPAGKLTVIATPVVGWASITNTGDADPGDLGDTNETLRVRREQELQSTGNGTIDAVEAAVSKVPGVRSVTVFENTTSSVSDGMPPHSIECVVFDGVEPEAADKDVAQAIWDTKAGGVYAHGNVESTAIDRRGRSRVVCFSRVVQKPVYVVLDVSKGDDYVGDSALKDAFVERANALHGVGDTVRYRQVDSLVLGIPGVMPGVPGVIDVINFKIGFEPDPSGDSNLAIGPREIAVFDTSRVTVA